MPKCWSISTTIRNPERNIPFLAALSRFEGIEFNEEIQAEFFKTLIKIKAYKPVGISNSYIQRYEDPEEFTDAEVKDILSQVHYENKSYNDNQEKVYAMRGRTAVGNLNKMGLGIAREAKGRIKITELGKQIMSGNADLTNVFLRYLLKWQLPNLAENGYSEFNIIPFVAVLDVIDRVNKMWEELGNKPVGVSKEEFALFLITLTDYQDIDKKSKEIIKFRTLCRDLNKQDRADFIEKEFINIATKVFDIRKNNKEEIEKKVNNLYDYGDSAIRYFRQTKLVYYRGNGRYVDLSPTRIIEIRSIINKLGSKPLAFSTEDDYLDYVADINLPRLPWENENDLKMVYSNLILKIEELQQEIENQYRGQALHSFNVEKKELNTIAELNYEINNLRNILQVLNNDFKILTERNMENIDGYIQKLMNLSNRKKSISGQDPLDMEWYTSLTLMAMDDAKKISPNYSVGDDNLPIFTAGGNTPDIECYYENFNMVCEVTLLKSRDQWYNEGQPVMRHFRDFEAQCTDKNNYCIFIAPIIHRDTLNTFWFGVKMGFEGSLQKIIPLTIEQYAKIVNVAKEVRVINNKEFKNIHIQLLLDMIMNEASNNNDSTVWISKIDSIIDEWGMKIA